MARSNHNTTEQHYQQHAREESRHQRGTANLHPDGCYFCGSWSHFSNECPDATHGYYDAPDSDAYLDGLRAERQW